MMGQQTRDVLRCEEDGGEKRQPNFQGSCMKRTTFILLVCAFLTCCVGCDGPVIGNLDNHCIVEYDDGTTDDIICSWAGEVRPAFKSVRDGKIQVKFHNGGMQSISLEKVRSWRLEFGDTDHFGRWVKNGNVWVRNSKEVK